MKHHNNPHQPVLLDAVLQLLDPKPNDRYLDLTAGFGGHSEAIISATKNEKQSILIDRDAMAVSYLKKRFKHAQILHQDYLSAVQELASDNQKFELILMDLGVSSLQLDQDARGFSFNSRAPLDMRMDQRQQLTADDIVNHYSKTELADLIYLYGDEPQSRSIAETIVQARPVEDTMQLSELISSTVRRRGRIHPATRTFQAIRMVVNDELAQLKAVLSMLPSLLNEGGRLAVISFHSLEDREVKKFFKEQSRSGYEATVAEITKRPISGTEDVNNPRARSAKLRAILKTNTKTKNRKEH